MKALFIILGIGVVIGAIYFFTRPAKEEVKTSTTTTQNQTSNTGLSGLLGGLNLSGLSLFGV